MPSFYFLVEQTPEKRVPQFFFNSDAYVKFHETENTFSFCLKDSESLQRLAFMQFEVNQNTAVSQPKAPFGFFETAMLDHELWEHFWMLVEERLIEVGVTKIVIRSWPTCYWPVMTEVLTHYFETQGFNIPFVDINFHWDLKSENAAFYMHATERWSLRKALKQGLRFDVWDDPDIGLAYEYLKRFKEARHIPNAISKEVFVNSLLHFKQNYTVFVVRKEEAIIAISVGVKVSKQIFYHYSHGFDSNYSSLSPSVLMYNGLFDYCRSNGYKTLDLGITSIEGVKQKGLYPFKKKMGGIETHRYTLEKQLIEPPLS